MNNTETKFFEQLMDSLGQCLTPEVAAKVASLRVSPEFQNRLDDLAERCTEGQLSAEEQSEYEIYVSSLNFIGILQAISRSMITQEAVH